MRDSPEKYQWRTMEDYAYIVERAAKRLNDATTDTDEDGHGVQMEDDDDLVTDLEMLAKRLRIGWYGT